jgi:hypothetical protein
MMVVRNTVNTTDTVINHLCLQGTYIPKIILTDNDGCHVPIRGGDTIQVNAAVTASFNFFVQQRSS